MATKKKRPVRRRTSRDYQNPSVGEVYSSKAGNIWEVTSVNQAKRRVKVKRTGFRDLGELEWNPIVLKEMSQLGSKVAEQIRVAEAQPPRPPVEERSGVRGWFGGLVAPDPDGRVATRQRSRRRYYVYVIASERKGKHILYVGQSAHKPAVRLAQHKHGAKYCDGCTGRSYARGANMRLVPKFYNKIPSMRTRPQAEKVERILARKLRSLGFNVEGGH